LELNSTVDFHLTSANDGTFLIRPLTARAVVWWKENDMRKKYVVDNTALDNCVILKENQKEVCDEIRKNDFDFNN
tara:strand:+ start:95962 stop:96186 length:225 start_codon:yes stop_codon:yes gene_type:complete